MNTTAEILAIGALVLSLVLACMFQQYRLAKYETEVLAYQTEIAVLHTESVQANERMSDAIKQADSRMQILQEKADKILSSKVPADCSKSVQWAIQQSSNFR